jgi:CheY-like chemotaxis protein
VSIRILIADDNSSVRAATRQVLESVEDCEIVEAENGVEALAKVQELGPHLVILDLAMPLMDGLTASREITKQLPDTPILLLTLESSPQVELEARKAGVLRTVPKSEIGVLVSAVRDALRLKQLASSEATVTGVSAGKVPTLRRIEDRVRALCAEIITTKDDKALQAILAKLRDALHQHIRHFRARLVEFPAVRERRVRRMRSAAMPVLESARGESKPANKVIPITAAPGEQPGISKISNE